MFAIAFHRKVNSECFIALYAYKAVQTVVKKWLWTNDWKKQKK